MALQRTRLAPLAFLPNAVAAIYTNPAATKSFVRGLLLHNTSAGAVNVQLHWVPAGGSATAENRFFDQSLAAKETLLPEVPFALVLLDEGETIRAVAGSASAVTGAVLGDKET